MNKKPYPCFYLLPSLKILRYNSVIIVTIRCLNETVGGKRNRHPPLPFPALLRPRAPVPRDGCVKWLRPEGMSVSPHYPRPRVSHRCGWDNGGSLCDLRPRSVRRWVLVEYFIYCFPWCRLCAGRRTSFIWTVWGGIGGMLSRKREEDANKFATWGIKNSLHTNCQFHFSPLPSRTR